jgi:hypothetical protein
MFKKVVLVVLFLIFAFLILFVSILRSASVKYAFTQKNPVNQDKATIQKGVSLENLGINYQLAYAGPVLPDSPLWPIKALRDRIWLMIIAGVSKKSELNLLFADKRLQAARELFAKGKNDLAYSTLTKSLKYLERASELEVKARNAGDNTVDLARTIANASLKHRQVLKNLALSTSEEVGPKLTLLENSLKDIFRQKSEYLKSKGEVPPIDPFDGM